MFNFISPGLCDVEHKEELPPSTVEKLYKLFNDLVDAIKSRGQEDYAAKLQKIPVSYHHQLNHLLQYMAQVLNLWEFGF